MSVSFWSKFHEYCWTHYMKSGDIPEPEFAYVLSEERWSPRSPWYLLREALGRQRCPACGKPYFSKDSAWNCHRRASAYILWQKFAHRGQAGTASMSDLIRGSLGNPHSSYGYYGSGPFGPFGP